MNEQMTKTERDILQTMLNNPLTRKAAKAILTSGNQKTRSKPSTPIGTWKMHGPEPAYREARATGEVVVGTGVPKGAQKG